MIVMTVSMGGVVICVNVYIYSCIYTYDIEMIIDL